MQATDSAPLLDVITRAETLEQTVAAIPMAVIVIDLEGICVLWSGQAEALYGWRASEVVGKPIRDLLTRPEDGESAAAIREKLQRGEHWMGIFRVRHRSGDEFEAWVRNAPVRTPDGRLVGIVGMSVDLADSELAHAELAIQRDRFRSLVDTAHDGIWMLDTSGRTTFANQPLADLLRCSLADLDGSSIFDFVDAAEQDEAERIVERLRAGLPQRLDFTLRRADGTEVDVDVAMSALLDGRGDVVGALSTLTDSTPERDASEALRQSEERFRRLFDGSPLGGVVIDRSFRVVQANAAFKRMLAIADEDLVGRTIASITHPDDRDTGRDLVQQLFDGELAEFRVEKRYVTPNGDVVHARVTASALRDPDGAVQFGIAQVEDITDAEAAARTIREQEDRLAMALDAAGLAAWELDLGTGEYTMADNLDAVYGVRAGGGALNFFDFLELVVPEDRDQFLSSTPAAGERFVVDFRIQREDGVAWLRSRGRVVGDDDGNPVALRGTTIDVTESVVAEAQRAEADAVHLRTLQAVPDAFIGTDGEGRVTDWNGAAEKMFGWSADEILGELLVERIFLREDRGLYQERIEALSAIGTAEVPPGRIELVVQHRDGRPFPVELSLIVVTVDGAPRMRAFVRDITDRRAHERSLTDRVLLDQLTGLPNRTLLVDRLDRAIRRVTSRAAHAAVLFIDLDRFQSVNERLGHSAADAVLVAVAARLRQVVGDEHTVARHGGDEFIVLCEDLGDDGAIGVADAILNAFAEPFAVTGRRVTIGVSIGVAPVTASSGAEEVIRDADIAMHQAKTLGGGRLAELEPASVDRVTRRIDLEGELRRALSTDQITPAFQPVVTLAGKLVSMEVLARWEHPSLGTISPAEFIPVAEETGLIVELGAHILDRACAELAAWRRLPGWDKLTLAANLSGRQLVEPDLVATVDRTLKAHGLPVDAICLEITESMLMDEGSMAAAAVDELADMGIVLSVDDFGTGFSSLLYLRRFPVHALKLDRSFVSGIGTSEVDTAIVASMIDLAHSLHLVAVAEGVETASQAAALRARGCDLAQGYLFSRPVPAAEFTALLDQPRFR